MKKILFVSHNLDLGGAQLLLKNIVTRLDSKLFERIVYSPLDGELRTAYETKGIKVFVRDFKADCVNRQKDFDTESRDFAKKISEIINYCSKNKLKLALRCAGTLTEKVLNEFDFSEVEITGIYDNNPALFGKEIKSVLVYPVDKMKDQNPDAVLILHAKPKFLNKELKKQKYRKIFDLSDNSFCIFKNFISYISCLIHPALFFARTNPDTILVNNARTFWAVLAGKLCGKKVIWAIHEGFAPETFRVKPQYLYFLSLKIADEFIFPSFAAYEFYKNFIPENKVHIIANGVDIEEIENFIASDSPLKTKSELNIPENSRIICTIATMQEIKGQVYFVKAALNLLKKGRNNLIFVLVGALQNEYSENIQKMIDNSGFKDNFRVIPVTKEAYKYFNIADIYVTSSFSETFCLSNIEAMAFKKPVIATKVCGIPETIEDGETGILIPAENMEAHIAEKISFLLENPDFAKKIKANAYNRLKEKFVIQKTAKKYGETLC